jgi:hypothetical protein
MNWQRSIAIGIAILSAGIGAIMATTPKQLGLHEAVMHWLPILMAMLNVAQSFLPKVQGEVPPDDGHKNTFGGFAIVALALWFLAGTAQAQTPVVKTGWRYEQYQAQRIQNEVQRQTQAYQLQQQHAPAPQAQLDPGVLALIAQLALRPQPEAKVYIIMPAQQQLPIAGQPQQTLPIAGAPQQQLPIAGQPQQQLPVPGTPQQVLPPGGQPQQALPISGQPQQTPQPGPVVIPPGPALPQGSPAPQGKPQQALPTGAAIRYSPAFVRR